MRKFRKIIGFMVFVFIILTVAPSVCYAEDGKEIVNAWISKEDMPITKRHFRSEVVDGKIYAIGGNDGKYATNAVCMYDPSTDKWKLLAAMNSNRQQLSTVVINGIIYAIGGADVKVTNTVESYDPIANKWTMLAPMNYARCDIKTEVIGRKIYAIGGYDGKGYPCKLESYDTIANKWDALTDIPIQLSGFQTKVINGKIYVISGAYSLASTNIYVYDPITNKWTSYNSLSVGRREFQAEDIDGKIYIMGGITNDGGATNSVEVYDPISNECMTLAPMNKKRAWFETEVIDGKIYAIGGRLQDASYSAEVYDPILNKWTMLEAMSKEKIYFQSVAIDKKIYAFGGDDNSNELYTVGISEIINPTNLSAVASNSDITLTWNAVNGANSYNIKRSEAPGGPYTTISSVSAITYTDTDVVKGKTYYYVVSAIASGTESKNSNEVSATIKLYAPSNLSATAGNAQITLAWNKVDGATNYNIKRSEVPGGPYTGISSVSGSAITFTDINVVKGKTYYYVVSAIASGTESQNSNEASATIDNSSSIDGNRAILLISFKDGKEKEYDLSAKEADAFVTWYDKRSDGTGKSYYYLPKYSNVKPFISRKEFIKFDSIESFEIKSYNE